MTANPRYAGGEEGFIGIAIESTPGGAGVPGTWVAPTQFLMAESDTLDSVPAHIVRDVYGGSRDSDQGHRTGKYVTGGNVGLGLYPRNGRPLLVGAIGKDVAETAIAADTTVSITTAGGTSTIVLTTGAAYSLPAIVLIDTGVAQEPVPVLSYTPGTKTMVVPALAKAHASAGTAVVQPAQDVISPYTAADNVGNALATLSLEDNLGGKYSERYPFGYVGKYTIKGAAAKFEVTAEVMCSADRVLANGQGTNPAPTAFNPNDPTWSDLAFEFTDGFMAFPADPGDTGTATLQLVADGQDWDVEINNNLKAEPCFDGRKSVRHFPKNRQVMVKLKMLNAASRPVAWADFVTRNLDVPWFAFTALNLGTDAAPVWHAICIYIPTLRFTKATEIKGLKDTVGEQIEATARAANGLQKIYVAVL